MIDFEQAFLDAGYHNPSPGFNKVFLEREKFALQVSLTHFKEKPANQMTGFCVKYNTGLKWVDYIKLVFSLYRNQLIDLLSK